MHSGLTDSERLAAWRAARDGSAGVVVGTRSAVFMPLQAPGLIIVDEEHDTSYKQQEGFRYSARDLAVMRARRHGIPIMLGSATPSLESLHNVQQDRYTQLESAWPARRRQPAGDATARHAARGYRRRPVRIAGRRDAPAPGAIRAGAAVSEPPRLRPGPVLSGLRLDGTVQTMRRTYDPASVVQAPALSSLWRGTPAGDRLSRLRDRTETGRHGDRAHRGNDHTDCFRTRRWCASIATRHAVAANWSPCSEKSIAASDVS